MKSLRLIALVLALGLSAYGQAVNVTANKIKGSATAPSGACSAQSVQLTTAGVVWVCASGTWTSSGGGTTINSTNGQVPYRVNSTTFGDSAFASNALNSTYLSATSGASGAGLTLTVAGGGANEGLILTPKGTGQIVLPLGSAAAPMLAPSTSLSSGIYWTSGTNLSVAVSGSELYRFGSGGTFSVTGGITLGASISSPDAVLVRAASGVIGVRSSLAGGAAGQLLVGSSTDTVTGYFTTLAPTANTNTVADVARLGANSTGTAAAGFGVRLSFSAESSTTNNSVQSAIESVWTTATHASRTGELAFSTVNNAGSLTERVRVKADGLGFAGVTFTNLSTTANTLTICTDCAVTSGADNTCTSGGSGALAARLDGVWRCFVAQN